MTSGIVTALAAISGSVVGVLGSLQSTAVSGEDPLKDFSDICRIELDQRIAMHG